MQGAELKAIRERLGMTREQFARALGYTGTDRNNETRIRRYENQSDEYQIPLYIARLAWLIGKVATSAGSRGVLYVDWMADLHGFPQWSGYVFEHTPDPEHAK